MDNEIKLRNGLLIMALILGLFLIYKMIPPLVFIRNINMTIIKQKGYIKRITDPQNIDFKLYFKIPDIDFPEGDVLVHPKLGNLGFKSDFFLDFNTGMRILREGEYTLGVFSDDGFQLWIDGTLLGEFPDNRPYSSNEYKIYLKPGEYAYHLYYFQGFGRLGLKAYYQSPGEKKIHLIGENSGYVRFR